jgi:hypothetical protein
MPAFKFIMPAVAIALLAMTEFVYCSEWNTTPMERNGRLFLVDVTLNNNHMAKMVVDTGSQMTVISRQVAEKSIGKNIDSAPRYAISTADGERWVRLIALDSISIGPTSSNYFVVAVSDNLARGVSGFLGMDFLREFAVRLNPANLRFSIKSSNLNAGSRLEREQNWWVGRWRLFEDMADNFNKLLNSRESALVARKNKVGNYTSADLKRLSSLYSQMASKVKKKAIESGLNRNLFVK